MVGGCELTEGKFGRLLQQLPGDATRGGCSHPGSGDGQLFLEPAGASREVELNQWTDSATHLIYHAMFKDLQNKAPPREIVGLSGLSRSPQVTPDSASSRKRKLCGRRRQNRPSHSRLWARTPQGRG